MKNRDCIIRAYLGRRRRRLSERYLGHRRSLFSQLRNIPLHIDQMEQLDLDVDYFATSMAKTLAIMHWKAQIDACDIEFVLAPPRLENTSTMQSIHLSQHDVWILGFDCCRNMAMNEAGVDQAWRVFNRNDPYCPRPNKDSPEDQRF